MKKRQRVSALFLCLCLLAMFCPIAASAAEGAQFVLTAPTGPIAAGESFTVTVELKNNPGFSALQFTVPYDSEKMDCTDVREKDYARALFSATNPSASKGMMFAGAASTSVTGDGVIVLLSFMAKTALQDETFSLSDVIFQRTERGSTENIVYHVTTASLRGESPAAEEPGQTAQTGTGTQGDQPDSQQGTTEGQTHSGQGSESTQPVPGGQTTEPAQSAPGGQTAESTQPAQGGQTVEPTQPAPGGQTPEPTQPAQSGQTTAPTQSGQTDEPAQSEQPTQEESAPQSGQGMSTGTSSGTGASHQQPAGGGAGVGAVPQTGTTDTVAEEPDAPSFSDVENHWGRQFILEAAKRKLFSGYTDGRFGPDDRVTRGQLMVVLWNLEGQPKPEKETPFTDLNGQSQAFLDAIAWGYGKGYISGQTATTFGPNAPLERQAAMRILFNYAGGVSGFETSLTKIYDSEYSDSGSIADWAKSALYWGVYHDIITGTSPTTLSPTGTMTRAQLATVMVKFTDRFEKNG